MNDIKNKRLTKPRIGNDIERIEKNFNEEECNDDNKKSQSMVTSCKYLCINIWYKVRTSWNTNMRIFRDHPYIPIASLLFLAVMLSVSICTTLRLADNYQGEMTQVAHDYAVIGENFLRDQVEITLESLHALLHGIHEEKDFQELPYKIGIVGEDPEAIPLLHNHHDDSYKRNVTGICDQPDIVSHFNLSTEVVMHAASLHGVVINSVVLAPYGVACLAFPKFAHADLKFGQDTYSDPDHRQIVDQIFSVDDALFSGPYVVKGERYDAEQTFTSSSNHQHLRKRKRILTETSNEHKNDHYHGEPSTVDSNKKGPKKEWILKIPISMPASHNYKLNNHWGFMVVSIDWDAFLRESGIIQFFEEQKDFTLSIVCEHTGGLITLAQSKEADKIPKKDVVYRELDFRDSDKTWVVAVGSKQGLRPKWLCLGISMSILVSLGITLMFTMILLSWQGHMDFLLGMIPKKALKKVRHGEVYAESFDMVTVFFSDIVGYTNMSSQMQPVEIMKMLNVFFKEADRLAKKHQLYKVETIGDAYMCVGGCPDRCMGAEGAQRVALFALDMIEFVNKFKLEDGSFLRIRCGLNSGKVVAGVVGITQPHFSLFGDTVNTAARMESTSDEMKIQCSDTTYRLLRDAPDHTFDITQRGLVKVKGKGEMNTWWINGVQLAQTDTDI